MTQDIKESVPRKEVSIHPVRGYFNFFKKINSRTWQCIDSLGKGMVKKSQELESRHAVSSAIILENIGKYLSEKYEDTSRSDPFFGSIGALAGFFGGGYLASFMTLTSIGVDSTVIEVLTNSALFSMGAIASVPFTTSLGIIAGGILDTATQYLLSVPAAIANISVGAERRRLAKLEPTIINPVPDRGVVPTALPAPSALIKLVTPAADFSNAVTSEKPVATRNTANIQKEIKP